MTEFRKFEGVEWMRLLFFFKKKYHHKVSKNESHTFEMHKAIGGIKPSEIVCPILTVEIWKELKGESNTCVSG